MPAWSGYAAENGSEGFFSVCNLWYSNQSQLASESQVSRKSYHQDTSPHAVHAFARLLALELKHKNADEIYELAFSRLTKPNLFRDLSGSGFAGLRASYLKGTDQRDLFIPALNSMLEPLDEIRLLDIGCGDGVTTAFALDADTAMASRISHLTYSDVNESYLGAYGDTVIDRFSIPSSQALKSTFDDLRTDSTPRRHNVCLIIHSLYFLSDTGRLSEALRPFLEPGALIFLVVADERTCFTGAMVDSYMKQTLGDETGLSDAAAEFVSSLEAPEQEHRTGLKLVSLEKQPSRIFADDYGDLIAAAFITSLLSRDGTVSDKIAHVAEQLVQNGKNVDLALETRGLRRGMLSVGQPQLVAVCEFIG